MPAARARRATSIASLRRASSVAKYAAAAGEICIPVKIGAPRFNLCDWG
jgi:hypothetical protein